MTSVRRVRRVERAYEAAMAELLGVGDAREVMARRELDRRATRRGDAVEEVAERVLYAIVKEA